MISRMVNYSILWICREQLIRHHDQHNDGKCNFFSKAANEGMSQEFCTNKHEICMDKGYYLIKISFQFEKNVSCEKELLYPCTKEFLFFFISHPLSISNIKYTTITRYHKHKGFLLLLQSY